MQTTSKTSTVSSTENMGGKRRRIHPRIAAFAAVAVVLATLSLASATGPAGADTFARWGVTTGCDAVNHRATVNSSVSLPDSFVNGGTVYAQAYYARAGATTWTVLGAPQQIFVKTIAQSPLSPLAGGGTTNTFANFATRTLTGQGSFYITVKFYLYTSTGWAGPYLVNSVYHVYTLYGALYPTYCPI